MSGRYFRPREVCPVCKTSVALKVAAVRGLELKYHERKGQACDGSYMKAKTTVEQAYAAVRA